MKIVNNEDLHTFGKWAETEIMPILSKLYGFKEINQTIDKFSRIDGIIFHNLKLTPLQIKARAPRVYYQDISIPLKQFNVYKKIALKNDGYIGIFITDIYNPDYGLDYKVYQCDFNDVRYTVGTLSQFDDTPSVFIKLNDMKSLDILPEEFQRELERKHIEYIRPTISEKYISLYKNKF